MPQDGAARESVVDCEAMGSVDSGEVDQFIIAYPCQDDAWASIPLTDAAPLNEWC
ncbi:DUF7556 family protein [Halorientalis sp.]|jgi:hypothetical protein|uniref:DUF7556 family protein n=1 Tax=Halorientalis sp. TaxID=1931229 RepID=UPI0026037E6D|nr:hypothetical protein [Halorientalis sp.]